MSDTFLSLSRYAATRRHHLRMGLRCMLGYALCLLCAKQSTYQVGEFIHHTPSGLMALWASIPVLLIGLIYLMSVFMRSPLLELRADESGISVTYIPGINQSVAWNSIGPFENKGRKLSAKVTGVNADPITRMLGVFWLAPYTFERGTEIEADLNARRAAALSI